MNQRVDGSAAMPAPVVTRPTRRWWQTRRDDTAQWTTAEALRTPAFAALTVVTTIDSLTWGVLAPFLPRHLDRMLADLPAETAAATAVVSGILAARVWASVPGRLAASVADFVSAKFVVAVGLAMEGTGTAMLLVAHTRPLAFAAVVLLGAGFGLVTASTPTAYADLFGTHAFAGVMGTRYLMTGFISPAAPLVVGLVSDRTGSFTAPFLVLAAACLGAAVMAALVPRPRPRSQPLLPVAERAVSDR